MYKLYSYWSAPQKTLRECSAMMIERFGVSLEVEAGEAGDEVIADLPGD